MASVNREAIETFMSITGTPETIAAQNLEVYGGNLNEAINAHFSKRDGNIVQEAPSNDSMDIDDPPQMEPRNPFSLLSATRGVNPFLFLDHDNLDDSSSEQMGHAPFLSQPREVREVPTEVKGCHDNSAGHSSHVPGTKDVTNTVHSEGPEIHGTVILDDENEDTIPRSQQGSRNAPSAPQFDHTPDYGNDIEEEMIRAAIEASKRDVELQNKHDFQDVGPQERPSHDVGADFEQVVSLSMKTAEHESLQREQGLKSGASGSSADNIVEMEELGKIDELNLRQRVGSFEKSSSSQREDVAGSLAIRDKSEELVEQPLVGSEETHKEVGEIEFSPALSPMQPAVASQAHPNGNAFPSDEWGGISSEEHDEAVMLEAAMFGGIPEGRYRVPLASNQPIPSALDTSWRAPRPPSPSLVAQRAIREQQDDEYFAALQADRERELRAIEEEKAAKEAELEEERRQEEESRRRLELEQELERQLAAKEASLPQEPPSDDENVITLLVKMPDGSRHGRRFLKSDKLQSLFDFIDIGRGVKPGTYRVVRPYPRLAFSEEESNLTLNELGLSSKQEALFLESM